MNGRTHRTTQNPLPSPSQDQQDDVSAPRPIHVPETTDLLAPNPPSRETHPCRFPSGEPAVRPTRASQ